MILQARYSVVSPIWRVVLATPLAWLILAITLWGHGAWLGTGVIDLKGLLQKVTYADPSQKGFVTMRAAKPFIIPHSPSKSLILLS